MRITMAAMSAALILSFCGFATQAGTASRQRPTGKATAGLEAPARFIAVTSEEIGLPVGAEAPDFTLQDQHGKEVRLQTLLKKGPVALVFYRSADW